MLEKARRGVNDHLYHLKVEHELPVIQVGNKWLFDHKAINPAVAPKNDGMEKLRSILQIILEIEKEIVAAESDNRMAELDAWTRFLKQAKELKAKIEDVV